MGLTLTLTLTLTTTTTTTSTTTTMTTTSTTTTSTTTTSEAECALGELGVDGCLDGYVPITNPQVCNDVSSELGYTYDASLHKDTDSAAALVCNRCEGCKGKTVRVDDCHGAMARWLCCKGTT